jgi:hypothetical protein
MMEQALRGVVREALTYVAARGLPGAHHFFITFQTRATGVEIPPSLLARYPIEMTIVLQYQFWGLDVGEHGFKVTLSFEGKHERLAVPFTAVTSFVDLSVQFGLQFRTAESPTGTVPSATDEDVPPPAPISAIEPAPRDADAADRVVKLDVFRKK